MMMCGLSGRSGARPSAIESGARRPSQSGRRPRIAALVSAHPSLLNGSANGWELRGRSFTGHSVRRHPDQRREDPSMPRVFSEVLEDPTLTSEPNSLHLAPPSREGDAVRLRERKCPANGVDQLRFTMSALVYSGDQAFTDREGFCGPRPGNPSLVNPVARLGPLPTIP